MIYIYNMYLSIDIIILLGTYMKCSFSLSNVESQEYDV